MDKLFNKTFFHFAFGFITLIALTFLVITVAGYVEERAEVVPATVEQQ